jgi:hypothetical protein
MAESKLKQTGARCGRTARELAEAISRLAHIFQASARINMLEGAHVLVLEEPA